MICKLLQEILVLFRLFFFLKGENLTSPTVFSSNFISNIKRISEHMNAVKLNFLIIIKLWEQRHAFCYIIDNKVSYIERFLLIAGGK